MKGRRSWFTVIFLFGREQQGKDYYHCVSEALCKSQTLMDLLTIMMASWRERSVSSMNCSAPPRRIIVQVLAFRQPVKKLYLPEREEGESPQGQSEGYSPASSRWMAVGKEEG